MINPVLGNNPVIQNHDHPIAQRNLTQIQEIFKIAMETLLVVFGGLTATYLFRQLTLSHPHADESTLPCLYKVGITEFAFGILSLYSALLAEDRTKGYAYGVYSLTCFYAAAVFTINC